MLWWLKRLRLLYQILGYEWLGGKGWRHHADWWELQIRATLKFRFLLCRWFQFKGLGSRWSLIRWIGVVLLLSWLTWKYFLEVQSLRFWSAWTLIWWVAWLKGGLRQLNFTFDTFGSLPLLLTLQECNFKRIVLGHPLLMLFLWGDRIIIVVAIPIIWFYHFKLTL